MKSRLYLEEAVNNSERKFGAANEYYPIEVIMEDGHTIHALFTEDQLATAIQRALRNQEDIPEKSLWNKMFG